MTHFNSKELSDFIWRTRYRDPNAQPEESSIADTWRRVAHSAAAPERHPALWSRRFQDMLQDFRFIPAGRILAGAGTSRHVTLFNCFVMGPVEDSIEGIFDALKEGAITMQQGGGVGYDFSSLRPSGTLARDSGAIASGPVSFMKVWDAACGTILSTGARRGAMMATLRCDHPDIETFIDAKRTAGVLTHFNLSVLVTDAFMAAVAQDQPWRLVFDDLDSPVKTVRARDLWQHLCDSAYECAEPGVLFVDRINAENNLGYCETLSATNPCAEEPLPPYGACNLGSLNLTAFVLEPFTALARMDDDALREAARLAVRFLDNIIDISQYPLARQQEQVLRSRRVGLGITGLADALAMLGVRYDCERAHVLATDLMRGIRNAAYEASVELAREKGHFPEFHSEQYTRGEFIHRLPEDIRSSIRRHGVRNSHLLAIAPAGSISLLAGNVSSGIEPIFGVEATRRVILPDGQLQTVHVTDYAYALWRARQTDWTPLPDYWVDSYHVSPRAHLLMQAALQPYVDGAISKTVTLPAHFPKARTADILQTAFDLQLKGCTVYREAGRPGILDHGHLIEPNSAENAGRCCDLERETD